VAVLLGNAALKPVSILNSEEALAVMPGGTAASADLGGSSKYSNENFED